MVVIGVDAHKRTHTVVAVDEAGRKLAERTAAATSDGHLEPHLARTLLGPGGLSKPDPSPRGRSATGWRSSPARADQAHGRGSTFSARTRQERPHRCAIGRSGGSA